jgi:hypothetical protein
MLYSMSELVLTLARGRVRRCRPVAEGVDLQLDQGSVRVGFEPDERAAYRVCGLATRVLRVDLVDLEGLAPRAEVTAVWHRVPHTRAAPVAAGLALTLTGVPTYVVSEASR